MNKNSQPFFPPEVWFKICAYIGKLIVPQKSMCNYTYYYYLHYPHKRWLFRKAVLNNKLDVVKYLMSIARINVHINDDIYFRVTCRNGYLEMAQYFASFPGTNFGANRNEAFRKACQNGHLEVAKFLTTLRKVDGSACVDIHAVNNYALNYACFKGRLEVVMFLVSMLNRSNFMDCIRFIARQKVL